MPTNWQPVLVSILTLAAANETGGAELIAHETSDRKPSHTVVPVYPERARRERLEGDVQVCFNIDRNGRTHRVRVRKSSHRIFEKPAVLAVRSSRYEALPDAKALSGIKTCRTFRFRLNPVAIEQPG
jgi:TonB family protein